MGIHRKAVTNFTTQLKPGISTALVGLYKRSTEKSEGLQQLCPSEIPKLTS